jgi:L-lactate dehydrogenase (cytochrome)
MLDSLRSVMKFRGVERDPVRRRLDRCANVADLRAVAERRLPGGVFDYIDGGAESEYTLRNNTAGYAAFELQPNVLRDVSAIDISTTLLGRPIPAPLVLAPTGFTRIAHPDGELAVGRAAGRAGLPYTLSTLGTRSIEELAAVAAGPLWFQVYAWKDRSLVEDMISRAAGSGYEAIMLTVDTAVLGRRERDVRRGFTMPPRIGLGTLVDGARHPQWSLQLVRNTPITFANVGDRADLNGSTPVSLSDFVNNQFDQALSWDSIAWLRGASHLPIVVKGIQRVDDAVRAADLGVDAIVISNHGGRQLDGASATISMVADVADAVGDRIDVLCDGGVRRGGDIVKACALGARAVMVGRPYLYGLAAGGERGVDHVIALLLDGLRRSMALVGRPTIADLTPDLVRSATRSDRTG